ncbi:patatin-like phospholipase family protein [Methylobacterium sp. P31]
MSLALQGGGSLGAFAWGVLDRLLEEEHLSFDAVSGASAGAVNAVILAAGLLAGGKPEARRRLDHFWGRMSQMAPPKRSAAAALFADLVAHLISPYQLNPFNLNPLKSLLSAEIDFEALRANPPLRLLIAATAVSTGRLRIFRETELTREMVLASASLPLLSQAVPIGAERYWDGGYSANPPLTPLVEVSEASDLLIVQIMPTQGAEAPHVIARHREAPRTGHLQRCLPEEAAALAMMARVAGSGSRDPAFSRKLQQLRVHHISADRECSKLSEASGGNLDRHFLLELRESGRSAAEAWLAHGMEDPALQHGMLSEEYSETVLPAV